MKKKLFAGLAVGLVMFGMAGVATATQITPLGVTASSTFITYNKDNLINDSGLTGGLHDTNFNNMWLNDAEGAGGKLTFNLGSQYSITSADIWQYNATCCGLDRGVENFNIFSSTDGVNFIFVTNAHLTESPGGLISAQTVSFNTTANYVMFDILSNYGNPYFTGLSEVKFNSGAAPVPEPATMLLMGTGLAGLVGACRKKRK